MSSHLYVTHCQKLIYFQNKARYRSENREADTFLKRLFRDEDINIKVCLLFNFSFLRRHEKTKNNSQWLKRRPEFLTPEMFVKASIS